MNKERLPLVSIPDESSYKTEVNELVMQYKLAFEQAFTQKLFDKEGNLKYPDLYTDSRYAMEHGIRSTRPALAEEQNLHELFWNKKTHPHPLVFISGHVGCGKSTLMRYYFNVHCPKTSVPGLSPQMHKQHFKHKCIVYIDMHLRENKSLKETLYQELRKNIAAFLTKSGIDIYTSENFLFFKPKYPRESKLFKDLAEAEMLEYCRSALKDLDDEEWVNLALVYLDTMIKKYEDSFPLRYLVLVIDSVDQAGYEVLKQIIITINQWTDDSSVFWRVFVPVWPTIIQRLREDLNPLPEHHFVELHMVEPGDLFKKRIARLIQAAATTPQSKTTPSEWNHIEAGEYVTAALRESKNAFKDLLGGLAGDSTRRLIGLWREIVSSKALLAHFKAQTRTLAKGNKKNKKTPMEAIGVYAWLDSLITGAYNVHHRTANPLPNVFFTVEKQWDCHDLLVGVHILELLLRGKFDTRTEIENILTPFGYKPAKILESMEYLCKRHVFQWVDQERKDGFIQYPGIASAYAGLLREQAYIENMAITTPLKTHDRMSTTVSYDTDQFVNRMRTSIEFVKQVLEEEAAFLESVEDGHTRGLLREQRFSSVGRTMGLSLHERVESLYNLSLDDDTKVLAQVSAGDWASLRAEPLFEELVSDPAWLNPYRVR